MGGTHSRRSRSDSDDINYLDNMSTQELDDLLHDKKVLQILNSADGQQYIDELSAKKKHLRSTIKKKDRDELATRLSKAFSTIVSDDPAVKVLQNPDLLTEIFENINYSSKKSLRNTKYDMPSITDQNMFPRGNKSLSSDNNDFGTSYLGPFDPRAKGSGKTRKRKSNKNRKRKSTKNRKRK